MEYLDFYDLLEQDQHDPEIQYQLGLCYLYGNGTEADPQEARIWLQRAADQGHEQAIRLLDVPGSEHTDNQITEETLPEWCARAEDGDADAQYAVANFFLRFYAENNAADIDRYLGLAAEQGHGDACLQLGERMIVSNPRAAVSHLSNAAESGIVTAMWKLAVCYGAGCGVDQSFEQAEYWYHKAAEQGGDSQKLALAVRYIHGIGVEKSAAKAMSWMYRATRQNIADAREQLERGTLDEAAQNWQTIVESKTNSSDAENETVLGPENSVVQDSPSFIAPEAAAAQKSAEEAPYKTIYDHELTLKVEKQAKQRATYWGLFGLLLFPVEILMVHTTLGRIILLLDVFAYMPIATKLLEGFSCPRLLRARVKYASYVFTALALLHAFGDILFFIALIAGYIFVSPKICRAIDSKLEDLSTIEGMEQFYNKHKGK
jgi:TPR repeat protein